VGRRRGATGTTAARCVAASLTARAGLIAAAHPRPVAGGSDAYGARVGSRVADRAPCDGGAVPVRGTLDTGGARRLADRAPRDVGAVAVSDALHAEPAGRVAVGCCSVALRVPRTLGHARVRARVANLAVGAVAVSDASDAHVACRVATRAAHVARAAGVRRALDARERLRVARPPRSRGAVGVAHALHARAARRLAIRRRWRARPVTRTRLPRTAAAGGVPPADAGPTDASGARRKPASSAAHARRASAGAAVAVRAPAGPGTCVPGLLAIHGVRRAARGDQTARDDCADQDEKSGTNGDIHWGLLQRPEAPADRMLEATLLPLQRHRCSIPEVFRGHHTRAHVTVISAPPVRGR
jgi:hypothetical protein